MASARHILIATEDREIMGPLAEALQAGDAFRPVLTVGVTGGEVVALLRTRRFDAVLLHVRHPVTSVRDVLRHLGRAGMAVPVIVLAQEASEHDVVLGLEWGAADYLVAPFRPAELRARLRAQIRSSAASENAVLTIGPYQLRPSARLLVESTRNFRIRLTHKEVEILKYLYRAAGEPVARQTLMREVWGYSQAARSHTVVSHIYRLRQKIEPAPGKARLLVNEDGGYRLLAAA